MLLLDITGSVGLSGQEAETILENIGISTNKNMIPFDTRKPLDPSGIRIGTAAITTRGFGVEECRSLAKIMCSAIKNPKNVDLHVELRQKIGDLCRQFPIPKTFI